MYEELIKRLREAPNDWYDADLHYEAADDIDKLVKICNSILSKYEEAAEAVIYEYSGHINIDNVTFFKNLIFRRDTMTNNLVYTSANTVWKTIII